MYYLKHECCPAGLESHKRQRLRLEASKDLLLGTLLFHRSPDGMLWRCVDEETAHSMLNVLYGMATETINIGGHFAAK